jgi:hypothetical protein
MYVDGEDWRVTAGDHAPEQQGGCVVSLDHDAAYAGQTRTWLRLRVLSDRDDEWAIVAAWCERFGFEAEYADTIKGAAILRRGSHTPAA